MHNCYQKCGSFTTLADLLLWLAALLQGLADLLKMLKYFRLILSIFYTCLFSSAKMFMDSAMDWLSSGGVGLCTKNYWNTKNYIDSQICYHFCHKLADLLPKRWQFYCLGRFATVDGSFAISFDRFAKEIEKF